jgi:hypothetical protein
VQFEGAYGNNRPVRANDERLRLALLDSIPLWGGGQKWDLRPPGLSRNVATSSRSHARRAARSSAPAAQPSRLERAVGPFGWRFGSALARPLPAARTHHPLIGNVGRDLRLGALACWLARARAPAAWSAAPAAARAFQRWLYGRRVRR